MSITVQIDVIKKDLFVRKVDFWGSFLWVFPTWMVGQVSLNVKVKSEIFVSPKSKDIQVNMICKKKEKAGNLHIWEADITIFFNFCMKITLTIDQL